MKYIVFIFFLSLIPAQLTAFTIRPGVVVYLHDIIIPVLILSFALTRRREKNRSGLTLIAPIAAFIAAATGSLIINSGRFSGEELFNGSMYLIRWILYAGIYAVAGLSRLSGKFWTLGLIGVGTALAVLGCTQFVFYPDLRNLEYLGWDPHYYRLFSTFLDPNFAGIILVLTILLGWYVRSFLSKWMWVVFLGVTVLTLYLTYSRSSFLAFLAALTVIGIIKSHLRNILILALLVMVGMVFIPKPGGDTLRLDRMESTLARLGNWKESIVLFQSSPVFGHGFNTLRYVQEKSDTGTSFSRAASGVDSSVLFILVTTGIAGLAAYVWLVIRSATLAKETYALSRTRELAIVVAASGAAIAVHSLFSNSAFYPWVMVWMWILLGVLEHEKEGERKQRSSHL